MYSCLISASWPARGALVLLDWRDALTVSGTILGFYAVDASTLPTLAADLAVCSGCVAFFVCFGLFIS